MAYPKLRVRRQGKRIRRQAAGFLLMASLAVIVFLTLSGTALLVNGVTETNLSLRTYNRDNALAVAEAGINQSALNLQTSSTADDTLAGTLNSGSYQIQTQQALSSSIYRVVSRGTSQLETRRVEAFYRATMQSVFKFALFANNSVQLSGSMNSDSFDSRQGLYNPSNHHHRGDAGTNNAAVGGIQLTGTSLLIDGQLHTGPNVSNPQSLVTGYNASLVTGGTSPPSDTQDVVALPSTIPMAPVAVPNGLSCMDTSIQSQAIITLTPTGGPLGNGSYCYHDLTVQGGATLRATGPVKVYVTGSLSVAGNTLVGVQTDPTQMIFYMSTTGAIGTIEGSLTGTANFYGAIYAPNADIAIGGNTNIYGAIVAQDVYVAGSAYIHYDEALANLSNGPAYGTVTRLAWHEL